MYRRHQHPDLGLFGTVEKRCRGKSALLSDSSKASSAACPPCCSTLKQDWYRAHTWLTGTCGFDKRCVIGALDGFDIRCVIGALDGFELVYTPSIPPELSLAAIYTAWSTQPYGPPFWIVKCSNKKPLHFNVSTHYVQLPPCCPKKAWQSIVGDELLVYVPMATQHKHLSALYLLLEENPAMGGGGGDSRGIDR